VLGGIHAGEYPRAAGYKEWVTLFLGRRFFDFRLTTSPGRIAPVSNEYGSLDHFARFIFLSRAID